MVIPDFPSIMLPLLKLIADGQEYYIRDIIDTLAWEFNLTDAQKQKLLPSGKQSVFGNRVGWARTYLKKAGIVESPRRAFVKITNRGLKILQDNPKAINQEFLIQYPEFIQFKSSSKLTAVDLTANEEWEEELVEEEDENWDEQELLEQEEWDDLEAYEFSAKTFTRKELLKIVTEDNEIQHTLLVEGEDKNIVHSCLLGKQKIVTVWNRTTALAIAKAIQQYYDFDVNE